MATLKNDSNDYKNLEALKAKVVSFKTDIYNIVSVPKATIVSFTVQEKENIAKWGIMLQNTNSSITDLEDMYETMYNKYIDYSTAGSSLKVSKKKRG